jgi:hypothetical protein
MNQGMWEEEIRTEEEEKSIGILGRDRSEEEEG